jgi:hypothetical protein
LHRVAVADTVYRDHVAKIGSVAFLFTMNGHMSTGRFRPFTSYFVPFTTDFLPFRTFFEIS